MNLGALMLRALFEHWPSAQPLPPSDPQEEQSEAEEGGGKSCELNRKIELYKIAKFRNATNLEINCRDSYRNARNTPQKEMLGAEKGSRRSCELLTCVYHLLL